MTDLKGKERANYVKMMFGRISKTYDLLNRLMTFGQDLKWRKEAVAVLGSEKSSSILDLGAGTGDMTNEILRQYPDAFVIGLDFTPEMIQSAKDRIGSDVGWVIADVFNLPFPSSTFSGATAGFLMRNLDNIDPVLSEQYRVLSKNGKFVCLETSPVKNGFLKTLIHFYIHRLIPSLGKIISRDPEAYSYLAISTEKFLSADEFSKKLRSVGFHKVGFVHRMFGVVAIHSAHKG